uniref:Uncharacterized protein n=1 Tax=Odontella aurita TaxID=265563 RepID=A0A7S4K595_9STRA|mmetsp:Transcript_61353/g.181393  ORF Transcript_61353/g.181393 Transcript_61353/m.181393 type:complete len:434 (+) Transcript_61353:68-1369(+)
MATQNDYDEPASGDLWLRAIQDTTACLRNKNENLIDDCLEFLLKLERILNQIPQENWDRPAHRSPPRWRDFVQRSDARRKEDGESRLSSARPDIGLGSKNPFADLQFDSDEEVNQNIEEGNVGDDLSFGTSRMDVRRILIRVLTSQSEAFASIASRLRRTKQWLLGAEQYLLSLARIHAAISLADSEISKWMNMGTANDRSLAKLQEDADIVEVSVQSLTAARENYLSAARRQEEYLTRKLTPQWQSRDEVKQRLGDRWYNNPNPKRDHASMREAAEKELKDIREAVDCIEAMDMDEVELVSQAIKGKVDQVDAPCIGQRYNRTHPEPALLSRRVSIKEYPDPTEFGWEFTGSSGATEFFQKDGVKLDWYFTTASVKTSMQHPVQGKTQLFASRVDSEKYRAILENPRVHTGERYQKRRSRNNRNKGHRPGNR